MSSSKNSLMSYALSKALPFTFIKEGVTIGQLPRILLLLYHHQTNHQVLETKLTRSLISQSLTVSIIYWPTVCMQPKSL